MDKYEWYIEILFKSGRFVKGFMESYDKFSADVFKKIMHVGEQLNGKVYESLYLDENKNAVVNVDITNIDSITISDKPIE